MSAPVFIEPIMNRDVGDCAISCLAMWTGRSYQDVIAAAPQGAHRNGLIVKDIVSTAAKLGAVLRARRTYDLHGDDGILMLNPTPRRNPGQRWLRPYHAALLLNGAVLDPFNGRLWLEAETYLKAERYTAGTLIAEDVT